MKKIGITLATLLVASGSMAATIFSDDFNDGNRNGWYLLNATSVTNTLNAETVGGQSVMSMRDSDTATDFYGGVTTFAAQDLSVAGSKITLSFDFYNDIRWPSGRQMSAGLYNSNGSAVTGDTTAAGDGWGATTNDSGMLATAQRFSNRFELRESDGQGLGYNLTRLQDRTNNNGYGEDEIWFNYLLEIENIGGDLITTATWDGSSVSGQDPAVQTWTTAAVDVNNYTFDQIGLTARGNVNFSVDNVVVDYVIPEPATLGLLAFSGLGMVMLRRFRN